MAFHVRDPDTDAAVRQFASDRNLGITEAIRVAVAEASSARQERVRMKLARIREISDEVASWPRTGLKADKEFFDRLSGD